MFKAVVKSTNNIQYRFAVSGSTEWQVMTEAGSISDEGTWYHNVITQDGVEPKLYVNGVESTPVWETTTDKTLWMAGNSGLDKLTLGCTQWNGAGVSDCANNTLQANRIDKFFKIN